MLFALLPLPARTENLALSPAAGLESPNCGRDQRITAIETRSIMCLYSYVCDIMLLQLSLFLNYVIAFFLILHFSTRDSSTQNINTKYCSCWKSDIRKNNAGKTQIIRQHLWRETVNIHVDDRFILTFV